MSLLSVTTDETTTDSVPHASTKKRPTPPGMAPRLPVRFTNFALPFALESPKDAAYLPSTTKLPSPAQGDKVMTSTSQLAICTSAADTPGSISSDSDYEVDEGPSPASQLGNAAVGLSLNNASSMTFRGALEATRISIPARSFEPLERKRSPTTLADVPLATSRRRDPDTGSSGDDTTVFNATLGLQSGALAANVPWTVSYVTLFLLDGLEQDIFSLFYRVIYTIEATRRSGGKVLVHCQQVRAADEPHVTSSAPLPTQLALLS